MQFAHFNISAPMALLEEVKDFYIHLFGLEVGFRPNFSNQGYWLYFDAKPILHLTQDEDRKHALGTLDHIAFSLTGLEAFTHKLETLGVEYHLQEVSQIGIYQVFFHDPSGIKLEANFNNQA